LGEVRLLAFLLAALPRPVALLAAVTTHVVALGATGGIRAIPGRALVIAPLAAPFALTVVTARAAAPVVRATLLARVPLITGEQQFPGVVVVEALVLLHDGESPRQLLDRHLLQVE
jgi:hypothetical protein